MHEEGKRSEKNRYKEWQNGMSKEKRKIRCMLEICVNFLCRLSFVIRNMRYRSKAIYKNMRIGRSTNFKYNLHKNITLSLLFKRERKFARVFAICSIVYIFVLFDG